MNALFTILICVGLLVGVHYCTKIFDENEAENNARKHQEDYRRTVRRNARRYKKDDEGKRKS